MPDASTRVAHCLLVSVGVARKFTRAVELLLLTASAAGSTLLWGLLGECYRKAGGGRELRRKAKRNMA